jgi:hypothetical protein
MATKKTKKQKGGRPADWREICMRRVPPWTGKAEKPPEPEETEERSETAKD